MAKVAVCSDGGGLCSSARHAREGGAGATAAGQEQKPQNRDRGAVTVDVNEFFVGDWIRRRTSRKLGSGEHAA